MGVGHQGSLRERNGTMKPRRIQRKRTKGWKMPKGAAYVGRPTKWGNPYQATALGPHLAYDAFVAWIMRPPQAGLRAAARRELRGRPLVCWCALDRPCHADVWLEIANA
jgi:hypothetical protein